MGSGFKHPDELLYLAHMRAANARVLCTRPIHCPIADCGRITSVQEYAKHVQIDHPRVPRYEVKLNHQQTIDIKLGRMAYGKTYCAAMLFVKKPENTSKQTHFDKYLTLPVFIAKLECSVNEKSKDQSAPSAATTETTEPDADAKKAPASPKPPAAPKKTTPLQREAEKISAILQMFGASPKGPLGMAPQSQPNKCLQVYGDLADIVIIWVAGKINDNYRCLLQVIDESGREGHFHNCTLHETSACHISRDVLLNGNHLLLHTSNFQEMAGTKNDFFELSVFILDKQ